MLRPHSFHAGILLFAGACFSLAAQSPEVDFSAQQVYEAHVVSVSGKVNRTKDGQPWAMSSGERLPVQQTIITGNDGYVRLQLSGGTSFEVYSSSRVTFRANRGNSNDVLDIAAGRVAVHLRPQFGDAMQRISTPSAMLNMHQAADLSVAIDEDETIRVDVNEGEITVQHTRLPNSEPTLVRAVDSVLIQKDQAISRQLDRGTLYRYTIQPIKNLLAAITPGHASAPDQPEVHKFFARNVPDTSLSTGIQ